MKDLESNKFIILFTDCILGLCKSYVSFSSLFLHYKLSSLMKMISFHKRDSKVITRAAKKVVPLHVLIDI